MMKRELYQQITGQILAAIEAGVGECRMPWNSPPGIGQPANAITARRYRGINNILLWAEGMRQGFASGKWATYRQWAEVGAQVRKGERSTTVLLWKPVGPTDADHPEKDEGSSQRMLARAFFVFNADQVDGHTTDNPPALPIEQPIDRADVFFKSLPASVCEGGNSASYDPGSDRISMPIFGAFVSAEAYYSVLAHELTHWTGAKSRLDRNLSGRFGSEGYAMEELVAELGAAFTVGHLDLVCQPRIDHARYIAAWLRVLANDPRAILTAASKAQAAADYLVDQAAHGGEKVGVARAAHASQPLEIAA